MGRVGLQPWSNDVAAIITGCVVVNQLVGPTLCRFGIRSAGEAREDSEEHVGQQVDVASESSSFPRQALSAGETNQGNVGAVPSFSTSNSVTVNSWKVASFEPASPKTPSWKPASPTPGFREYLETTRQMTSPFLCESDCREVLGVSSEGATAAPGGEISIDIAEAGLGEHLNGPR